MPRILASTYKEYNQPEFKFEHVTEQDKQSFSMIRAKCVSDTEEVSDELVVRYVNWW